MDLPNLLSKLKTSDAKIHNFLAVEIGNEWIKTAIWTVENQVTKVTDIGKSVIWNNNKADELIHTITQSIKGLDQSDPPQNAIFGLEPAWVVNDTISQDKKPLLSQACKQLSINPIGFVVTLESIIEHFKMTEGGPLSAIIIHLESETVSVSIVKLGRLIGTQSVGKSDNIAADVEEGLARFPQTDNIPSRMIIYNAQKELQSAKQELIAHDWLNKLPFLHIPKIEALPPDGTITAIAVAGGGEVVKSFGITGHINEKMSTASVNELSTYPSDIINNNDSKDDGLYETWADIKEAESKDEAEANFGFTDINIDELTDSSASPVRLEGASQNWEDSDQFLTESDVAPVDPHHLTPQETEPKDIPTQPKKHSVKLPKLPSLKLKIPRLKIPRPTLNKKLSLPPLILIGVFLLLILFGSAAAAYWYLPKATVTIYVQRKTINRNISATLSTSSNQIDLTKQIIPAEREMVEVSGTQSQPTTGTKIIGNRAAGRVAIYNRTLQAKTFSQGTTIQSGDTRFTLDEDVRLASASTSEDADFSLVTTPSKAEVAATAIDIGSDYNVAADTTFTVANFSENSFIARSVVAFVGGSSREVSAVSEKDVANLEKSLISQLQQQIADKVAQSSEDKGVVPIAEPDIIDEEYSHQIGEQAESIELSATISQEIYTYNLKDINLIAQQLASQDIPPNYSLDNSATQIEITDSRAATGSAVAISANVNLKVIPVIDKHAIAQNITGKYPPVTESYLKSLSGYVRAETAITPNLPARLNTFPRVTENIEIIIHTLDN